MNEIADLADFTKIRALDYQYAFWKSALPTNLQIQESRQHVWIVARLFHAAAMDIEAKVECVRLQITEEQRLVQNTLQGMPGPKWKPSGKQDSTLHLFHATPFQRALGILHDGAVKVVPQDSSKGRSVAIYGKSFLL